MTTHSQKLNQLHSNSSSYSRYLPDDVQNHLNLIAQKSKSQKGVFTVLITLLVHKSLNPSQDIRYHQSGMEGGFSGRTIDTQEITPILKRLGYPSMAESGWLTRSLEQPYPYTMDYNGKIGGGVRNSFLTILDLVEQSRVDAEDVAKFLLQKVQDFCIEDQVEIVKLEDKDDLTIDSIIGFLQEQFLYKYSASGGSKLPVIAFHSIYQIIIKENKRYEGALLKELGSHTASDRTSRTSGDVEIFKASSLFESVEIKLDKVIDETIVRVAIEKIYRHNPKRYYILSNVGYDEENFEIITELVNKVRDEHGCQIIINGLVPTLKYYLRLISDLNEFLRIYLDCIEADQELKQIHKTKTNEFVELYFS
jgi:DNA (cytosine-5)-methyltransferase 1